MKEGFIKKIKETGIMLPPLADYTDYPFRKILADFNPPFMCTEMVSPEALLRENPKTLDMLRVAKGEHLNGAQLVGADPVSMGDAASILEEMGYNYIDINMGCIVNAVRNTGAGFSLMQNEEKAVEVVSSVIDAVDLPITCKMRLGVNERSKNATRLAMLLEENGVVEISVHGRTGETKFGNKVDYGGIREVVENVDIPVIANGGIYTGADALEMLEKTGASGVMPGRGLIGNPWIVPEIQNSLKKTQYEEPSLEERKKVFQTHLEYLCEFYGERTGVIKARRIIGKYFAGSVNIGRLKLQSVKTGSKTRMISLLDGLSMTEGRVYYK